METNVEKKTKVSTISRKPFPAQINVDQKQWKEVEYLKNYLCSIIKNDARCDVGTTEIIAGLPWQTAHTM